MTDNPNWYEQIVTPALLRHARVTYGSAMRQALDDAGYGDIPQNGLYVLGGLAMGAGDAPLGVLVRDLRISKQAAGQLVETLVGGGYLERTVNPDDRRKLTVALTARGRKAAAVQTAARERIDTELIARAGADDVATMRRTLAALIDIRREREAAEATAQS